MTQGYIHQEVRKFNPSGKLAEMRLEFKSKGLTLAAILDAPSEKPTAFAIFAACFTCNKNIKTAAYLGRALAAHGIATLRFDFAGHGESEGDFRENTLSSNIEDIVNAAAFLSERYVAPSVLIGHSFGGVAAIRAAPKVDSIKAVITVNSPADPSHLKTAFSEKLPEIEASGQAMVGIVGRPFPITRNFLRDLEGHREVESIEMLKKPLLICHATDDDVVPFSNAEKMFAAANHPKSVLSLGKAGHYLFHRPHAEYAAAVIAAWLKPYLGIETNPT